MRLTLFGFILLWGLLTLGGCGGNTGSLVDPNQPDNTVTAQEVLTDFADACSVQDSETILPMLLNPDTWKETLENNKELLPIIGHSLTTAEIIQTEENCVTYAVKISHPDHPSYSRKNYIFVVRYPGERWKIDFDYPDIDLVTAFRKSSISETRSAEWDANSAHPMFSRYIVDYYCAKYTEDSEFIEALGSEASYGYNPLIEGSREEDFKPNQMAKFLGHYYSPSTQGALVEPSSLKFYPISLGLWASVGVLEWLLDENQVLPYFGGPKIGTSEKNPYTFPKAIDSMKNATSNEAKAEAFNVFGFTLHLLEDCAVPAHVRNDCHIGLDVIGFPTGQIGWDGDYMEVWTTGKIEKPLPQSFLDETTSLYNNLLSTERINLTEDGFLNNALLNAFLEDPEYPLYDKVEALFQYTAVMTNRMCFSNDTVYKSLFPQVQTNQFPDFTRANLVSEPSEFFGTPGYEVMESLKQLGIISNGTTDYLIGRGNIFFDAWLTIYLWSHTGYPPDSIIESILRNPLNRFVSLKDLDDTDYYANDRIGVREQQWRLLFPLIVKTGAAYLHECYNRTHASDDPGDIDEVEFTLVGTAQKLDTIIRLTESMPWQGGAAWNIVKQPVETGFDIAFQFQITDGGGFTGAADGLAFVIQNNSAFALGDVGGYMGYGGIGNSLAVEFDTYQNNGDSHVDPDDNHISIQTRGTLPNSPDHSYSLGETNAIPNMKAGAIHLIRITYAPGILTIYFDNMVTPILTASVDLANILALDNGTAWMGYTATTGNGYENHDVFNWVF